MKYLPKVYYLLSLLLLGVGIVLLLLSGTNMRQYASGGGIVLLDLFLVGVVMLVQGIRKEGRSFLGRLIRSIRFRLALWYMATMILLLIISGNMVFAFMRWSLSTAFDKSLGKRLVQIASSYEADKNYLALGEAPPSQEIAFLLTPRGEIQQSSFDPALKRQEVLNLVTQVTASNSFRQILQRGLVEDYPVRSLRDGTDIYITDFSATQHLADDEYGFDLARITDQQHKILAYALVGMPIDMFSWLNRLATVQWQTAAFTLFLVGASGYWLAGRAMRPVQHFTHTARQISEKSLDQRLRTSLHDEFGELAATFNYVLERLEDAFERQRRFTSDASHELRTPLAIVDLEVTRALAREHSQEEYRKMLTVVQQEIFYMSRLVNDLLTLSRAEAGQTLLHWEEIELSETVVDTVERLASLAQEMGVEIAVTALPELVIRGDHTFLMQLLVNVVENAVKYTAGSGSQVLIEMLQCEKDSKQWAKVCISDDGPGIAEEHRKHLFERFYRTDQSRTHHRASPGASEEGAIAQRGSGLGLSIAKWIVHEHGGDLLVRSEYGQGSTFEIWLPILTTK
ncbi:HAMP domain-containing histidine kinase [Ktedonosporobacter rubrisoli]|uniref:histidine kinase n=1 Tax=Ktedonosporobacter rubrisoli TaxID=2509675 RepID=A0A4V0Z061_KTERU|nr:HAMP domain-containing sensor histidine kinase [Ktedonosporobacter rubrisoli]QBD82101.1 HAMP domain-containing histidine kinase [Ktedonosporobacter rubrisoli]